MRDWACQPLRSARCERTLSDSRRELRFAASSEQLEKTGYVSKLKRKFETVRWAELGQLLQEHPAKSMLWEAEPARETVERLHHRGVEIIVIDPCGNWPAAGDFLCRMAENAVSLERVYRELL